MTQWPVRQIQGHGEFDSVLYYNVAVEPTWESEDRLQHMLPALVAWDRRYGCSDSRKPPLRRYDPTLKHWSGKVTGRRQADGLAYYKIEWQVTREPAANLKNATSLAKEYWDKLYSL
ncbi:hypothetical protein CORC01_12971 [Colletotrichum orchidophilum]|uniref:Uncharacterized protein n=1 Tax=Colletotrichum orchidophilum TaxID=1209926 RepID=A0A1G4ARE3_9PEZI|nr:uncharacterized protein CORC01_12971 [Colletotrichum orchidophilum]OHE91744.1 hypothetical protein CORC01_12971 [Colletotrichum orchidophilum]